MTLRNSTPFILLGSLCLLVACGDGEVVDGAGASSGTSGTSGAGGTSGVGGTGGRLTRVYTPFALSDCDDGTVGEEATGPDALESVIASRVVYSAEQAFDGVGQSCKSSAVAGKNFFGGRFRTAGIDVGNGDDLWIREALYFPSGFCFGHGTSAGDGWGVTKWNRVEFDDGGGPSGAPGSRLTMQLGNFASNACNASAEIWGASREFAGAVNATATLQKPITTGKWQMVQWHVHFAPDNGGYIRFWLDDEFLGQWDGQTLPSGNPKIKFIQYGDYWNGSPYQDVAWYIDEIIMTSQKPDTQDAGGRPYISTTTRVADWD